jgi:hypothetical protein
MASTRSKIISVAAIVLFIIVILNIYNIALFIDQIYVPERLTERKVTFGDNKLSKDRNVYVKDLNYISSIKLNHFDTYIEKGFWFDPWDINKTVFNKNTNYPYQISFSKVDTTIAKPYCVFKIVNIRQFDSLDNKLLDDACVYLKKPKLEDTLVLKIIQFDKKRDSIGYIKIWE